MSCVREESLGSTPEAKTTLYVNNLSLNKKKKKKRKTEAEFGIGQNWVQSVSG